MLGKQLPDKMLEHDQIERLFDDSVLAAQADGLAD